VLWVVPVVAVRAFQLCAVGLNAPLSGMVLALLSLLFLGYVLYFLLPYYFDGEEPTCGYGAFPEHQSAKAHSRLPATFITLLFGWTVADCWHSSTV
jgi:hypothetical protein